MRTVAERVEQAVNQSPYLREAISAGVINLSALARKLQPDIEQNLMKKVSEAAVFMSLRRLSENLPEYYAVNPADYLDNLGLRSNLFELTVKNSAELMSRLAEVGRHVDRDHTAPVFTFTQGVYETTIITSTSLRDQLLSAVEHEELLGNIDNLVGITLQRTHGQIETTGVLQFPLRILAWEGISVIEIVTTLNELMIVVRDFEVDRAIVAIRQALANSKH